MFKIDSSKKESIATNVNKLAIKGNSNIVHEILPATVLGASKQKIEVKLPDENRKEQALFEVY